MRSIFSITLLVCVVGWPAEQGGGEDREKLRIRNGRRKQQEFKGEGQEQSCAEHKHAGGYRARLLLKGKSGVGSGPSRPGALRCNTGLQIQKDCVSLFALGPGHGLLPFWEGRDSGAAWN